MRILCEGISWDCSSVMCEKRAGQRCNSSNLHLSIKADRFSSRYVASLLSSCMSVWRKAYGLLAYCSRLLNSSTISAIGSEVIPLQTPLTRSSGFIKEYDNHYSPGNSFEREHIYSQPTEHHIFYTDYLRIIKH